MNQPLNVFDDATARDLVKLVRLFRVNGWLGGAAANAPVQITPRAIHFRNESGEEAPAYACMQVVNTDDAYGNNFLRIDKPNDIDGTRGYYIFNGPDAVPNNDEGVAQSPAPYRAFKDSADADSINGGDRWSPVVDEWYLEKSDTGFFQVAGEDDIADDVFKVFPRDIPIGMRVYKAHASGIAARSGATLGSASCNRVYVTSGTRAEASPTENETIYNNYTTAIDADIDIKCALIDGIWVVVGADC